MKRITYLLSAFVIFSVFTFTSCKEDKYLDWKYINKQWLEQHKDDEGWQITSSGLYYKMIHPGEGTDRPSNKSGLLADYSGMFINDKVFDSGTNAYLTVSGVIPGFGEALKMMTEGSVYEFRIPYGIGYGKDGFGTIPPYTTLRFRVTLIRFWTE